MTDESWERLTRRVRQAAEELGRLRRERDRLLADNERLRRELARPPGEGNAAPAVPPPASPDAAGGLDAERLEHLEWERQQVRERLSSLLRRLEEAGLVEEP